ncbi:M57 family metalloprotease [Paraliomyxa miuraensis]|uniref:M57 family metalloprotease n=1 Tax=Paraliomyxa miuraensis TaxID=376150 RepID=UPI002256E198|nr:M57 family metalloprotease [Paraliomyxa miuraensis]MCX4248019.1 zinc-dependent metalloprotease [Paraliomyxa miuraensis]
MVESDDVEVDREAVIAEIVDNLVDAGYPESEIEVREDGEVFVGGDAHVTLGASREMIGLAADGEEGDEEHFRHFRTNNLVGASIDTICINGKAFSGTMSTGLDLAIQNYNQQNLQFTMVRFNTNNAPAGCDAVIVGSTKGPVGGQSGFPSGGLPYDKFQVGKGTANYGADVVEHVITHELGHAIGFRHSDYFDRSYSCGSGGNEGDGGVGAVHISGTPNGYAPGSVMNSCFTATENGEWANSDITALNALY